MTIVVDENIPFAREAFSGFGEVRTIPGREIDRSTLNDADALIVRSITRVDAAMLEGTPIRFVGTATIGTDHVDMEYLAERRIEFADARGCNANSVAEYVVAALLELHFRQKIDIESASVGIVGVGAIGSIVARYCNVLGLRTVLRDPLRHQREPEFETADLGEVMSCDVITLHVPLSTDGIYATMGMVDTAFLQSMRSGAILINSSRGGVAGNSAIENWLDAGGGTAVLDVWEGEPEIPVELIEAVEIATPHIAGYSLDARAAGTAAMAAALAAWSGAPSNWTKRDAMLSRVGTVFANDPGGWVGEVRGVVRTAYDITRDDAQLRKALSVEGRERRDAFDRLRRDYAGRREFSAYTALDGSPRARGVLEGLGFSMAR